MRNDLTRNVTLDKVMVLLSLLAIIRATPTTANAITSATTTNKMEEPKEGRE